MRGLSPRRAADPVNIVLGLPRHIEIDDVAQRGHVDATFGASNWEEALGTIATYREEQAIGEVHVSINPP